MTFFCPKKLSFVPIFTKIDFLGAIDVYFPKMMIFEISDRNAVIYRPEKVEKTYFFDPKKMLENGEIRILDMFDVIFQNEEKNLFLSKTCSDI